MAVERYAGEWAREILGLPELPESERTYFHPSLRPEVEFRPVMHAVCPLCGVSECGKHVIIEQTSR